VKKFEVRLLHFPFPLCFTGFESFGLLPDGAIRRIAQNSPHIVHAPSVRERPAENTVCARCGSTQPAIIAFQSSAALARDTLRSQAAAPG